MTDTELLYNIEWDYEYGVFYFDKFIEFMNSLDPIVINEKYFNSYRLIMANRWKFNSWLELLTIYDEEFAIQMVLYKPDWLRLIRLD